MDVTQQWRCDDEGEAVKSLKHKSLMLAVLRKSVDVEYQGLL